MSFQFDGKDKIMRNVDDHDECLRNLRSSSCSGRLSGGLGRRPARAAFEIQADRSCLIAPGKRPSRSPATTPASPISACASSPASP